MRLKYTTAFVFVLLATVSMAQEVVQTITSVPTGIITFSTETTDTLSLPFQDDFSDGAAVPSLARWSDQKVYVNDHLCSYSNSVGVATLDGTNANGFAYKPGAMGSDTLADVLTSNYIDLSSTTNVFLTFQLQEGGLGELPSSQDSIVVEFYAPSTGIWEQVWGQKGTGSAGLFKSVAIPVDEPQHLAKGFRFRFAAYGSRSGQYDLWHIDYVQLDKDRNAQDTVIAEPAIARRHPSLTTAGGYTSWPWWMTGLDNTKSSFDITYRRMGPVPAGGWSLNLGQQSWSENGTQIYVNQTVPVITNTQHNQDLTFTVNVPANALNALSGPVHVESKVWFDGTAAGNRTNDTVRGTMHLDNYLALDDGTAERAYGIQNVIGGRVAQKYETAGFTAQDLFRGLDIHFVTAGAPYMSSFKIALWTVNDTSGIPDSALYISDSSYVPSYGYSRGDFMHYVLDTSGIDISGYSSVYIGIIMNSADALFMGLDEHTTLPVTMPRYYGDGFNWYPSLQPGAAMMRPFFKTVASNFGTDDLPHTTLDSWVYPNPTSNTLRAQGVDGDVVIQNTLGQVLWAGSWSATTALDVSNWDAGLYILFHSNGAIKWYKK